MAESNGTNGNGWIKNVWQIAQHATPITVMILVVLFTMQTRYLLKEQELERGRKEELIRLLLAEQAAHVALALRCARNHGSPTP